VSFVSFVGNSGRGARVEASGGGFRILAGALMFLCVFGLRGTALGAPSREAMATVVVFNAADPVSVQLSQTYAAKRQIPAQNLVGLTPPMTEDISRADYTSTIATPLRKTFAERGWWLVRAAPDGKPTVTSTAIRFVALIRGIPLRIAADPTRPPDPIDQPEQIRSRNEASVDSEIAALADFDRTISGIIPNPYADRFARILDWKEMPGLLLVARLDAADPADVTRMINDSVATEATGLWGWSYADMRGLIDGPYAVGDDWIRGAALDMMKNGLPVICDRAPETFAAQFPVTEAAVYYGWYTGDIDGPFADPKFRFLPGAIAAHIHSFSATSLRNPASGWTAPLLAHGAAAALGNVFEPYLALTTNLATFQDRLMQGFTLAESAWIGTRGLSWMTIVVGDPLYRPYGVWSDGSTPAATNWTRLRDAAIAVDGGILNASAPLQALSKSTGSPLFLEALGQAQALNNDNDLALANLAAAGALAKNDAVRFRLVLERTAILVMAGRRVAAVKLLTDSVPRFSDPGRSSYLSGLARQIDPVGQSVPKP